VGAGRSVFHDTRKGHKLRLLRSTAYESGMVVNRYAPASWRTRRRADTSAYLVSPDRDL